MEDRPDSEADAEIELTPEQVVAADEAMLLDLGEAERLADEIADQSLGKAHRTGTSGSSPTPEPTSQAPEDGDVSG